MLTNGNNGKDHNHNQNQDYEHNSIKEQHDRLLKPILSSLAEQYQLTRREHEMLYCLCEGYSNRETADALNITEKTVKIHISNLLAKTDTHSTKEVMAIVLHKTLERVHEAELVHI